MPLTSLACTTGSRWLFASAARYDRRSELNGGRAGAHREVGCGTSESAGGATEQIGVCRTRWARDSVKRAHTKTSLTKRGPEARRIGGMQQARATPAPV
jgi:hypothetical protein